MAIVRKVCLSISAITILAVAVIVKTGDHGREALCDGRRYEMSTVQMARLPILDSAPMAFRANSFWTMAQQGLALSLPSFESGNFDLRHYDMPLQTAERQLGVIGTDFLSLLSVQFTGSAVFLGAQPCQSNALHAHGLIPIAQSGFFSSDPSTKTESFRTFLIDEFEAFVPARGGLGGHQQYKSEEVNDFLAHLNRCSERNVFVIAATNEPGKIDSAVRRTGRLGKLIYVGPLDLEAGQEMLALHLKGRPAADDLNLKNWLRHSRVTPAAT